MRIVATLTTIPSRFRDIEPTLHSLIVQTKTLDAIYLSLPRRSLKPGEENIQYELPDFLQQSAFSNRIQVVWLDYDYGPVCKLFGGWLSESDPGTLIIILDDDIIYSPTMVADLYRVACEHPQAAVGFSGCRFLEEPPYIHFELNGVDNAPWYPQLCQFHPDNSKMGPFPADMLCGVGAFMIRRRFLPEIDTLKKWSQDKALRCVDDVTINACLSQNGIKRLLIRSSNTVGGHMRFLSNALSADLLKAVYKHLAAYRSLRNTQSNVFQDGCAFWQSWTVAILVTVLLLFVIASLFIFWKKT